LTADAEIIVYVVDDEEAVRDSLAFLLSTSGFGVQTYPSALAFLEVAPSLEGGCLVTDLRMPEVDGVELLRRLSIAEIDLPTVVVTGEGDVQMAIEAMKNGASDFIEKPFSEQAIIESIRRALGRSAPTDVTRTGDLLLALSELDLKVLKELLRGHPNNAIALELGIGAQAIERSRANIMAILKIESLADLVRATINVDLDQISSRAR